MERDFIDIRSSSEEDEEEKRFGDASNSEEADFALALSLQLEEQRRDRKEIVILEKAHFPDDHRYRESEEARNFEAGEADCSLFDPNPDIHSLFIQFNHQFFRGTLASVEVKWSKRMTLYSCVLLLV